MAHKGRARAAVSGGKGESPAKAADAKRIAASVLSAKGTKQPIASRVLTAKGSQKADRAEGRSIFVTVRRIGGSEMCNIPKIIQEEWGEVRPRTRLLCRVEGGRLIFERIAKPRLTLKERIALCDLSAPMGQAEQDWMENAPAGEELL